MKRLAIYGVKDGKRGRGTKEFGVLRGWLTTSPVKKFDTTITI